MGSACCVASKNKKTPPRSSGGRTLSRNGLHSPSISAQVDDNKRVVSEIEGPSHHLSHGADKHVSKNVKSGTGFERGNGFYSETHSVRCGTPASQKSLGRTAAMTASDRSSVVNHLPRTKSFRWLPAYSSMAEPDSVPPQIPTITACPTPSRRAHPSPNNDSASERRPSSDSWGSDLDASSHGDRWSFGSDTSKTGGTTELHACGACLKCLTDKPLYGSCNGISVVAVLVCGHAYHADCLEMVTLEANKFDPTCPACAVEDGQVDKRSEGKGRSNKISRNQVMDSCFDGGGGEKTVKREARSGSRSSLVKPFVRRHLSPGVRTKTQSGLENGSARKSGFSSKHR